MNILVINSGSSSIKYQLFDMTRQEAIGAGLVERIGESRSRIKHRVLLHGREEMVDKEMVIENHRRGLQAVAQLLMEPTMGVIESPAEIAAVGHRVVHGGEQFSEPTVITEQVKQVVRDLAPFAPLHNPPNLQGIEVAEEIFPGASQVAVFDTAFHQTLPPSAYRYAIPNRFYQENGIRVYGFHGTSHLYVTKRASEFMGQAAGETNLITAHLGNGASITAVQGGRSVDTSMGFTPLPGLIMGSRCGDIDPAVVFYLGTQLGMSFSEIDQLLNKESGLLGISGANDLRDIEDRKDRGEAAAQLALDMYTYRIKKYIGAYMAALQRVDALVFTAGVGENSSYVRWHACAGLNHLGIVLDWERNVRGANGPVVEIQAADSPVKVLIIPTNEELEIATQTLAVLLAGAAAPARK
jgi:acetate kinase